MFHGKEMRGMEGEQRAATVHRKQSKAELSLDTIARQLGLVAAGPLDSNSVSGVLARMFVRTLLLLSLLPLAISLDTRPHELTIHRHIHRRCSIVRARRIPRHRRLSSEHRAVSSSRVLFNGDRDRTVEQVTVFATDTTSLQDHFSRICPDVDNTLVEVLPTVATDTAQQHPFANGKDDFEPSDEVIPLEVTELRVSGPSSNRVDVTLFADGCELSYCLVTAHTPRPHCRLTRISLTRCLSAPI
jgi:hypothetical protein